jgi:hypothetical protein
MADHGLLVGYHAILKEVTNILEEYVTSTFRVKEDRGDTFLQIVSNNLQANTASQPKKQHLMSFYHVNANLRFVAVHADSFEALAPCAWYLGNFQGVCPSPTLISSNFSSVSLQHFDSSSLLCNDPLCLNLLKDSLFLNGLAAQYEKKITSYICHYMKKTLGFLMKNISLPLQIAKVQMTRQKGACSNPTLTNHDSKTTVHLGTNQHTNHELEVCY